MCVEFRFTWYCPLDVGSYLKYKSKKAALSVYCTGEMLFVSTMRSGAVVTHFPCWLSKRWETGQRCSLLDCACLFQVCYSDIHCVSHLSAGWKLVVRFCAPVLFQLTCMLTASQQVPKVWIVHNVLSTFSWLGFRCSGLRDWGRKNPACQSHQIELIYIFLT